jgi:hypothetical protein
LPSFTFGCLLLVLVSALRAQFILFLAGSFALRTVAGMQVLFVEQLNARLHDGAGTECPDVASAEKALSTDLKDEQT